MTINGAQGGGYAQGINNDMLRKPDSADSDEQKRKGLRQGECETCKERRYQDGSDDSGVSYQTPSKIKGSVESAVRAHEQEHVSRRQAEAEREGKEVVSQTVTLKTGVCPECGKLYCAGGTTRTVTRDKVKQMFGAGTLENDRQSGKYYSSSI